MMKHLNSLNYLKCTKKEYYGLALLVIVSIFVRWAFNFTVEYDGPLLRADSLNYVLTAVNLWEHGSYSYDIEAPYESSTLLVPGYPLFLTLTYIFVGSVDSLVSTILNLQIILGTGSVILTYFIARHSIKNHFSFIPAALLAVYPHQIISGSYLLTESLFTFLFLLACLLIIITIKARHRNAAILAGVIFAFAISTRPIVLLFLPFLFLLMLIKKEASIKLIGLAIALSFITWIPWSAWSKLAADKQVSNARSVVTLGTYPNFTYESLYGFPNREDPQFSQMSSSWPTLFSTFSERFKKEPMKYTSWYIFGKPVSLWQFNIVQGQGGAFIYPIKKSLYNRAGLHQTSYFLIEKLHPFIIYSALLAAFAVVLLSVFGTKTIPLGVLISSIVVVYITCIHIPFASLPRFSIPFQGFALILCTYLIQLLWEYKKRVFNAD